MYSDNTVEGPGRPLRERERKRKRKRKRKTGTVTQRDHLPKRGGSRDLPYTQLPREKREPVRRSLVFGGGLIPKASDKT